MDDNDIRPTTQPPANPPADTPCRHALAMSHNIPYVWYNSRKSLIINAVVFRYTFARFTDAGKGEGGKTGFVGLPMYGPSMDDNDILQSVP
jgi:hypothetical protein